MLNVCDPCLMLITRYPRDRSSAASRTVSVVFPLCFLPITATIGGRCMLLRQPELVGRVHIHEDDRRIAESPDGVGVEAGNAYLLEESDDAQVVGVESPLDRRHAQRIIVRAQRF